MEIEITKMSSKGQIVIPQNTRKEINADEGTIFAVTAEKDTIILKKIEKPSFEGFDKLLKKTQEFVKKNRVKPSDVEEAIKRTRNK